jgi:MFS transporter, UMF1 family
MAHRTYDIKQVLSWAFYDWANSAYATTVMAGFFPIFFKKYWSTGLEANVSTLNLGTANSVASIIVAAMAPLLGSIADSGGYKKRFLVLFASLGVLMTGSLNFVAQGHWGAAMVLYILGTVGFAGGNIFYDSLLVGVAPKEKLDVVSALGYSLGYLGGGLLFALNVSMVLSPSSFGLQTADQAVRLSFVLVAIWWALFSLPIMLFVKEPAGKQGQIRKDAIRAGFRQLACTFREIRRIRVILLFLVGYWLYIDGVDTIILMAVDYGMSIGLDSNGLIKALLITQFVGFPAAILFGKIGEKAGTKNGILLGIIVYVGASVWGFFMRSQAEFYGLAVAIGLIQGGVQSLSRAFYAKLIPHESAAEFFGFYNMLGKFAAVIGPTFMGWVGLLSGNPRYSIFAVTALFIAGGTILCFVRERSGSG